MLGPSTAPQKFCIASIVGSPASGLLTPTPLFEIRLSRIVAVFEMNSAPVPFSVMIEHSITVLLLASTSIPWSRSAARINRMVRLSERAERTPMPPELATAAFDTSTASMWAPSALNKLIARFLNTSEAVGRNDDDVLGA